MVQGLFTAAELDKQFEVCIFISFQIFVHHQTRSDEMNQVQQFWWLFGKNCSKRNTNIRIEHSVSELGALASHPHPRMADQVHQIDDATTGRKMNSKVV